MNNSRPLRDFALAELRHSSCRSITALDCRECDLWSMLFVSWQIHTVIMRNSAEVKTEQTNRCRVQAVERWSVACVCVLTAHQCPNGGTSSPFSCLTERAYTTKWCRRMAACPSGKLGSTSSPAAPVLPPGFTPKYSLLSTVGIFCCLGSHQDQCHQLRRRERVERCQGYYHHHLQNTCKV